VRRGEGSVEGRMGWREGGDVKGMCVWGGGREGGEVGGREGRWEGRGVSGREGRWEGGREAVPWVGWRWVVREACVKGRCVCAITSRC